MEEQEKHTLPLHERILRDELISVLQSSGIKVICDSRVGQIVLNRRRRYAREHRVYHGSSADFNIFDHSHMGEGEGAQAYGWGTYVTEVEGIGKMYAETASGNLFKSGFGDFYLDELRKVLADNGSFEGRRQELLRFHSYMYEKAKAGKNPDKDNYELIHDYELLEKLQAKDISSHHLYTVEIPEDNGYNYLHWEQPLNNGQIESIRSYLRENYRKQKLAAFDASLAEVKDAPNAAEVNAWVRRGENIYKTLTNLTGSDKDASLALSEMGFTGVSMPAQYQHGGRADGARNFVIFNEKDAHIVDHARFFRTPYGKAYGFVLQGKIFIDPEIACATTPIHEYSHLWAAAFRKVNPEEWKNIVRLMKGSFFWNHISKVYGHLTKDDDIADEVLAHYSGKLGTDLLRDWQKEIEANPENIRDNTQALKAIGRLKAVLDRFWKGIADWLGIHFTTAFDVAKKVLTDMMHEVNPQEYAESGKDAKFQFIGTTGASGMDRAEKTTARLDNLNIAIKMETAHSPAKAIKLATGWERGADGDWRYEIQDAKEFDRNGNLLYRRNHPDYGRYILLQDKEVRNLFGEGPALTDEERKEYEKLSSLYGSDKFGGEKLDNIHTVEAYVDAPELYTAYPELKDIRLTFRDTGGQETASYHAVTDLITDTEELREIVVNTGKISIYTPSQELKSVILHELQHAIQDIEGFANGGNEMTYRNYLGRLKDRRDSWSVAEEFAEMRRELGPDASQNEVYNALLDEYSSSGMRFGDGYMPSRKAFDDGFNLWVRGYDQEGYEEAYNEYQQLIEQHGLGETKNGYIELSGEVEARNVQKRMNLTDSERRTSLASDTEDVPRDRQIIIKPAKETNYHIEANRRILDVQGEKITLTVLSDGSRHDLSHQFKQLLEKEGMSVSELTQENFKTLAKGGTLNVNKNNLRLVKGVSGYTVKSALSRNANIFEQVTES